MIRKNKKLLTCLLVVILLLTCVISVAAYFTARDTAINKFTVAEPKVTVIETPESGPYEWGMDTKKVKLRNDSTNMDGYVRCTIFPIVTNSNGNIENIETVPLPEPDGIAIIYKDFVFMLDESWENNWIYRNGYFYYKHELAEGETTPLLLTGVFVNSESPEKFEDLTVTVNVSADIIQREAIIKDNAWSDISISSDNTLRVA